MSVMKRLWMLLSIALCVAHAGASPAGSPVDLLEASDRARGGGLPGVSWTVRVTARDGSAVQTRELVVRASGDSSLLEFLAPLKVKGQKMLLAGRNMWFVQPGIPRPVPISPRQRLTGQAANGDIASTNYASDYTPTLLREDTLDGEECVVLDLQALNRSVTYDRILYWVAKSRRLGLKAEFLSVSGKPLKTAVFEYGNQVAHRGRVQPFVSRMVITDALSTGSVTTLEYSDVEVGAIPPSTFNLNLLVQ
jgi:hypothetical protein